MKKRISDNMPTEEKKIYYSKSGKRYLKWFITGIDGYGKEVEVIKMPSPKVFLFKILPLIKNLSEDQLFRLEQKYDSLQPTFKIDPNSITPKMRDFIFSRDKWTCSICKHKNRGDNDIVLNVDHIIPKSKGGSNNYENLRTLCYKCNIKKSNKILDKDALTDTEIDEMTSDDDLEEDLNELVERAGELQDDRV